jgi:hypothetical protein
MNILIHDAENPDKITMAMNLPGNTAVISDNGRIHPCVCCFGCWVKTPGRCVINDGYQDMGALISKCDRLVVIANGVNFFTRKTEISLLEMWFYFPAGDCSIQPSARDRSGIFALEGQKLERIARSCRKAAGCAQIRRFNRVGILAATCCRVEQKNGGVTRKTVGYAC